MDLHDQIEKLLGIAYAAQMVERTGNVDSLYHLLKQLQLCLDDFRDHVDEIRDATADEVL